MQRNNMSEIFPQSVNIIDCENLTLFLDYQLGGGSYGRVYRGLLDGEEVAIKILKEPNMTNFTNEVMMLEGLDHEHIISLKGVCPDEQYIVTEFCENGCLYHHLGNGGIASLSLEAMTSIGMDENPGNTLKPWTDRLNLVSGIAKGMDFLHDTSKKGIIHRDLKSPNILLKSPDNDPVIADFGSASSSGYKVPMQTENLNPTWLPPEVIIHNMEACPKCDVYSFAIVMWEILTGEKPWGGIHPLAVYDHLSKGRRPTIPSELPRHKWPGVQDYVKLMEDCWDQDLEKRPDFRKVNDELNKILENVQNENPNLPPDHPDHPDPPDHPDRPDHPGHPDQPDQPDHPEAPVRESPSHSASPAPEPTRRLFSKFKRFGKQIKSRFLRRWRKDREMPTSPFVTEDPPFQLHT